MDIDQRIARLSPTKLALLEQKLKKNKPVERPAPRPIAQERQKYAPLSLTQERLWFLDQLEPDSGIYNLPTILPLRGPVSPSIVELSIRQLVERHGALRTRFVVKDEHPHQVMTDNVSEALDFSTIDLRADDRPDDHDSVLAFLSQTLNDEIWIPFNLATGPLLRARLILRRDDENMLLVVMHHIISDGWSLNVFSKEFRILLEAAHRGSEPNLPPAPLQYVDYAITQRQSLEHGDRLGSLLSYWRTQLEGAPAVLGMPLDHPRPARQSFKGALYPFDVSRACQQKLSAMCRECGVVPFMVLLSAFKVLLFRYTHQSKIVVGTPIANRNRSELEGIIGFFTNTLVLCSTVAPTMSFRELLAQVREITLEAYEHQDLPFEKLVSELQPERSLSHNPLFQVMFTFQNLPTEKVRAQPARPMEQSADLLILDFKHSKFDLTLAMTETDHGLSAVFEYATDLFEIDTIERMAGHLVNILEHVLERPDDPIAAFSFLSQAERNLILNQWNDTSWTRADILPLHGRFEQRVVDTPDSPAVVFRDVTLTYAELNQRANHVAHSLRNQGVERGDIVSICLPRSIEMVTGLLAILKVGAVYMPIEPDYPSGRVAYMIGDAGVKHVLTTSSCRAGLSPHEVDAIAIDELEFDVDVDVDAPSVCLNPSDLAYVLFTSGSTGQPKGIMISHGAIDNRLQWMQEAYDLQPTDRVMQKTPFTFDVSVWEFFWPLSVGACLVLAEPERHKESVYLVELIQAQQVTCLHFVPSMLQMFLHEDISGCDSLNRIICSGEALTIEQCRGLQALPGVRAHNLYGPTEAAVDVTHWDCAEWRDQYLSVPIGRPIANTQIYILNDELQPSPIGVAGELHIGGHNLAQGYLNKPELTAKQFIANPFTPDVSTRLYKTGDLARFRSDGNIEYIGRVDSQIKLRGLRIELGEIESVLRQVPGVAEAVVIVHEFGKLDERLAAYVVLDSPDGAIDINAVSAVIGRQLPSYMIPATIMSLPELPLSRNGKLDRKRLPKPSVGRITEPTVPVSDVESELLEIWRRVLKIDSLGTNDDFFALGGHSILVIQVINSINAHFHQNVPVRLLFENPTVKGLARALSEFEDDEWLEESKLATDLLKRSNRRLLQTLDELSEEQIDDFLQRHLDGPRMARFDDVESLLKWSRTYRDRAPRDQGPHDHAPKTEYETSAAFSSLDSESMEFVFLTHYSELTRLSATLNQNTSQNGFNPPPVSENREQARRIFESYAREMTRRLSACNEAPMMPDELRAYCAQMMSMAALAGLIEFS